MYNLRLLKIFHSNIREKCKVYIHPQDQLQFLPDKLRFLHWEEYPWKSFPLDFRPQYLVELNLPQSNVQQLWEGSLVCFNFVVLDLKCLVYIYTKLSYSNQNPPSLM